MVKLYNLCTLSSILPVYFCKYIAALSSDTVLHYSHHRSHDVEWLQPCRPTKQCVMDKDDEYFRQCLLRSHQR